MVFTDAQILSATQILVDGLEEGAAKEAGSREIRRKYGDSIPISGAKEVGLG